MFDNIMKFFKKFNKKDEKLVANSKNTAKERLHLVLMQDRANVSADFLELMKQEIIDVIKKYIEVDENAIDVRLTNKKSDDGTNGAPALYANIPILNIKNEETKIDSKDGNIKEKAKKEDKKQTKKENEKKENKEEKQKEKKEEIKEDKNEDTKLEENKEEIKEDTKKESPEIEENKDKEETAKEEIKSEK